MSSQSQSRKRPTSSSRPDYAAMNNPLCRRPPGDKPSKGKGRDTSATGHGNSTIDGTHGLTDLDLHTLHGSTSQDPGTSAPRCRGGVSTSPHPHPQEEATDPFANPRVRAEMQRLNQHITSVTSQLRAQSPSVRPRPRDGSSSDESDSDHAPTPSAKRRKTSADEAALAEAAARLIYLDKPMLTVDEVHCLMKGPPAPSDGSDSDPSTLYSLVVNHLPSWCRGELGDEDVFTICKRSAKSRTEAANRIRSHLAGILGENPVDLEDGTNSERRQALTKYVGLAWAYFDPEGKKGLLQSDSVMRAISALLYGPVSVSKSTAEARAVAGSKGVRWGVDKIPPHLVAFAVTITTSCLRGEPSFTISDGHRNLKLYKKVMDYLLRTRHREQIFAALNERLIPARDPSPPEEDDDLDLPFDDDDYLRSDYERSQSQFDDKEEEDFNGGTVEQMAESGMEGEGGPDGGEEAE